jgi:hypothetical protein
MSNQTDCFHLRDGRANSEKTWCSESRAIGIRRVCKREKAKIFCQKDDRKLRKRKGRGEYYVGIKQMKDKISNKRRHSQVAHLVEVRGLAGFG